MNNARVSLRGLGWDHPRGIAPVRAAAAEFVASHPDVEISWHPRSLVDFAFKSVDEMANEYDLILIDHPHVGPGGAGPANLLPLDEWIDEDFLADQARNSVGPSHESYSWSGHQWALAVDAAAQVAAFREDLLPQGWVPPTTWDDFLQDRDIVTALPLVPIDAACCLLSVCANIDEHFWDTELGIDAEVLCAALGLLVRVTATAHRDSFGLDPRALFERMTSTSDFSYVPLVFGYSNYARIAREPRVRFCDIPTVSGTASGSVLGGVGLAVSARCGAPETAAAYAAHVASAGCQRGTFFDAGGQPGHRDAWTDDRTNQLSGDFFCGTLRTLDRSYLRPRLAEAGHSIPFQRAAGELMTASLATGHNPSRLAGELHHLERRMAATHDSATRVLSPSAREQAP